jgi:type I restriction enzyme S subunit
MRIVPLSSVLSAQPRNGWSPPAEFQTNTGFPVLTLSSVTGFEYDGTRVKLSSAPTQDNAHYWLQEGELLITRSNTQALVGHAAIYDGTPSKAICCDLIMKMRVDPTKALTRFVYFYLRSPQARSHLTSRAQGASSTMKKIGKKVVQDLPIPLPSLPEQRRIVGILDEAFEGIATGKANAERNLQNARAIFESHLQSVFTAHHSAREFRQLADVCEEITVGHVGSMATQYKEAGVPFLRSQNIRPFRVSLDNLVFIDESFHRSLAKSTLRPGDVAIVRTGYPGTAAVIPESLPECNCSDLVIARPGNAVDAHYLALFFNSDHGKSLVAGRLVGAAQKHFNVTAAKQVAISLPSVPEQRRIVAQVRAFGAETQRLDAIYQQKLAELEALKNSLLHQAFTGQL